MDTAVVLSTLDDEDFPANALNHCVLSGILIRILGISFALPFIPIGTEDTWINHSCVFVDLPKFFNDDFGQFERCLTMELHHLRLSPYFKKSHAPERKNQEDDWRNMNADSTKVWKQIVFCQKSHQLCV